MNEKIIYTNKTGIIINDFPKLGQILGPKVELCKEFTFFLSTFYGERFNNGFLQLIRFEDLSNAIRQKETNTQFVLRSIKIAEVQEYINTSYHSINHGLDDVIWEIFWSDCSTSISTDKFENFTPDILRMFKILVNVETPSNIIKWDVDLFERWDELITKKSNDQQKMDVFLKILGNARFIPRCTKKLFRDQPNN